MKKELLKTKIFLITFFVFSFCFVIFYFFQKLGFSDISWQLKEKEKYTLTVGTKVVQKFVASRDGLSEVQILFSGPNLKEPGKFKIELRNENCSEIIRETEIEAFKMASDNPLRFKFSRIPDSKGKVFCLELAFNHNDISEKTKVYFSKNPHPDAMSLYYKNDIKDASLAMRPVYLNENWRQNLSELNQRISQYKPVFLKHYFLYVIAFSFILITFLLVLILILIM